jgi:hypothetical protein
LIFASIFSKLRFIESWKLFFILPLNIFKFTIFIFLILFKYPFQNNLICWFSEKWQNMTLFQFWSTLAYSFLLENIPLDIIQFSRVIIRHLDNSVKKFSQKSWNFLIYRFLSLRNIFRNIEHLCLLLMTHIFPIS